MENILLEICCGSLDDALEAEGGGADRVELCSALFLGGLTPSLGTVIEAKTLLNISVMVMIRPRGEASVIQNRKWRSWRMTPALAVERGADGIVFGILNQDGTIDVERCKRILKLTGGRQAVLPPRLRRDA